MKLLTKTNKKSLHKQKLVKIVYIAFSSAQRTWRQKLSIWGQNGKREGGVVEKKLRKQNKIEHWDYTNQQ